MITKNIARKKFINQLKAIFDESEAKSIARIVFEDVFYKSQDWTTGEQYHLDEIQKRLLQSEPLQYILGEADFFGMKLKVTPDVLIPRQETEELVALIIENVGKRFNGRILDIGTGSGCIALALQRELKKAKIEACDIDEGALQVAKANANRYALPIQFHQLDILKKAERTILPAYDLIVSNPPYIPLSETHLMPEQVKKYEPSKALFVSNEDALLFYRHIAQFAQRHTKINGKLFFELNEFNADQVKELIEKLGFEQVKVHPDLNGKLRMLSAKVPITKQV